MLTVSYAVPQYPECQNVECHYAECHYVECHYAECHGAVFLLMDSFIAFFMNSKYSMELHQSYVGIALENCVNTTDI